MSPTQLSLRWLRHEGWFAWVVEHWNSYARIRQDLWGFADVLALRDEDVLAVQTTSYSNIAARVRKINDHPNVDVVRKAAIQIHVHGWRKVNGKWVVRIEDCS